ncbi:MAG: lamin tail domain-containing protein, partial [Bacteroidota bacterium]
ALRPGLHGCIIRNEGKDINDQLMRDLQRQMDPDGHGLRGIFAHLYINGVYWGVYNPSERANDGFAAAYYGGEKEEWDAIKRKIVLDGQINAWNTLQNLVNTTDLRDPQLYQNVQQYVDVRQFADYAILCNYGPHSDVHPSAKNSFAIRQRTGQEGFKFFMWDSEPALWSSWRWTNSTKDQPPFNNIWGSLLMNEDFRMLLADRLQCHGFNDGVLTPNHVMAEYQRLFEATDKALIGEAARWKDKSIYEKIFSERDSNLLNYLPTRTDVLINTYRENGNFPLANAIDFATYGGKVDDGFHLSLSNPNPNGHIWYTTDGSDPRLSGGDINPSANQYNGPFSFGEKVVEVTARNRYLKTAQRNVARGKTVSQSSTNGTGYAWKAVDGNTNGRYDHLSVSHTNNNAQAWFEVDLDSVYQIDQVKLWRRTDCCTDRLDDYYVLVSDVPFTSTNLNTTLNQAGVQAFYQSSPAAYPTTVNINQSGRYVRVQLTGTNFLHLAELEVLADDRFVEWSAACPRRFYRPQDFSGLLINEIHYQPGDACEAEFIEILNVGTDALDLSDCYFSKGISYTFPFQTILQPDSMLVLAANPDSFYLAYGFLPDGDYVGKLSNEGERIRLKDPFGETIDELRFSPVAPWDTLAAGNAYSLELLHPLLNNEEAENWKASLVNCGTPRAVNSHGCEAPDSSVIIHELNYHYDFPLDALQAGDWVELYNPSANQIDLSAWKWQDSDTLWTFPNGSQIAAGGYLVLASSVTDFQATHSGIGPLLSFPGLGLSGKGERLVLRRANGCPADILDYDNQSPWPQSADGEGPSLMLSDPALSNDSAQNWIASNNLSGKPGTNNQVNCLHGANALIINEINYKSGAADSKDWVEIYNPGTQSIDVS